MKKGFNPWKNFDNFNAAGFVDKSNELPQWPIKLWQVPVVSPYFHGAHLLVAADCSAFACPSFHDNLSRGKVPLISDIMAHNDIKSVTVVKMEAQCCSDLEGMVRDAVKLSHLPVPVQVTNLFITAEIVD